MVGVDRILWVHKAVFRFILELVTEVHRHYQFSKALLFFF